MQKKIRSTLALALAVILWAPAASRAQAPQGRGAARADAAAPAGAPEKKAGQAAGDGKAQGPQVTVQRSAGGRKVFRIETGFVIEGRIQKPNAFYVLQRSQINYDWSQLNQDFAPRILESVRHSPF